MSDPRLGQDGDSIMPPKWPVALHVVGATAFIISFTLNVVQFIHNRSLGESNRNLATLIDDTPERMKAYIMADRPLQGAIDACLMARYSIHADGRNVHDRVLSALDTLNNHLEERSNGGDDFGPAPQHPE